MTKIKVLQKWFPRDSKGMIQNRLDSLEKSPSDPETIDETWTNS